MAPLKIKILGIPGKKEAAAARLDDIVRQQYAEATAPKPKPKGNGK